MSYTIEAIILIASAVFLTFLISLTIGAKLQDQYWHGEAIKRGFAKYNSKTGEWEWNDEVKEPTR